MKKLLLTLLFVPLVSFGQEYKVTRVIDGKVVWLDQFRQNPIQ